MISAWVLQKAKFQMKGLCVLVLKKQEQHQNRVSEGRELGKAHLAKLTAVCLTPRGPRSFDGDKGVNIATDSHLSLIQGSSTGHCFPCMFRTVCTSVDPNAFQCLSPMLKMKFFGRRWNMSGEGKKRDIIIWCWLEVGWSLHNDDSSEAAT